MDAIKRAEPRSAHYAADALGEFGARAKDAVPELIRLAKDKDREHHERSAAVKALGNIGPASADALPLMTALLNERQYQAVAIEALGKVASGDDAVQSRLVEILIGPTRSKPIIERTQIALSRGGAPVAAKLVKALDKVQDNKVRQSVMAAIGMIGPAAKEAVPKLIEIVHAKQQQLTLAAAIKALGDVGPCDNVIETLCGVLGNRPHGQYAVNALAAIGRPAIRPLTDAMKHENAKKWIT